MSFPPGPVVEDMRILTVTSFVSLDGVLQAAGGPYEDQSGGFTLGGWAVTYFDEEMLDANPEPAYELLLGRGTYEMFVAHWPYATGPVADHLNSTRKYVASTTLDRVEWNNSTLIEGDVASFVAELKRGEGPEVQVHGSAGLVQTLLANDLVDEYRVWIFPVVVGSGKRLFGDGAIPMALRLVDAAVSKTGVLMNTYVRAGEIPIGEMDFDQPTEAELERRRRLGIT